MVLCVRIQTVMNPMAMVLTSDHHGHLEGLIRLETDIGANKRTHARARARTVTKRIVEPGTPTDGPTDSKAHFCISGSPWTKA